MMRLLASGLVLLTFAAPAVPAVPAAPTRSVETGPAVSRKIVRGVIVKIDTQHQTFVLHTKGKPFVRVKVTAKTDVFVDGNAATFADLVVGMKARVRGKPAPKHHVLLARVVRAKT